MDRSRLRQDEECRWVVEPDGAMLVPAVLYASAPLIDAMDDKVLEQLVNVTTLPGVVGAAYAMPDAHWGYGFPIGGVAAFDPDAGGVVSAGGVGFDVSCGVRLLATGLTTSDLDARTRRVLADDLFRSVPSGIGSRGAIRLEDPEMDAMLTGGARWAVEHGYGEEVDLERVEESGRMEGADPSEVSDRARRRQRDEIGTLGSGNHYLEVQQVAEVLDDRAAEALALSEGAVVVSVHCGSRGLGHQIGTEFLSAMVDAAPKHGIALPDRELACAPIRSELGRRYLGAMRAAINCALANRQVITHLVREAFRRRLPDADLRLVYDVSHNTCKVERHRVAGALRELYVHRKGATRAFGPGDPALPAALRDVGQPVIIGGTMGTASYLLVGTADAMERSFGSACHGAGRAMSRHEAARRFTARGVKRDLGERGIEIRSHSKRGIAEEAPAAYKDVDEVVDVAARARLARPVLRLEPLVCVKG